MWNLGLIAFKVWGSSLDDVLSVVGELAEFGDVRLRVLNLSA